ncbi:NUDIX domain-containing protein [Paenibacillus hodogayensis]|uniref:NUDIX domain-containing protein n=1 Tax=Paenibacillus hodogayensis TaxID=279208 RepID=A0ABV5W5G0_9BACL
MKPIRNSAKAVIVQDGSVLLTKNKDAEGFFYLFPGGGQEPAEELKAAVVRECLEEIGRIVTVGELLHVREYIGKNHQFAEWDADVHQVEFYFRCDLCPDEIAEFVGSNPDDHQVGVEWIELARLSEVRLYPQSLADLLRLGQASPCYLGDTP